MQEKVISNYTFHVSFLLHVLLNTCRVFPDQNNIFWNLSFLSYRFYSYITFTFLKSSPKFLWVIPSQALSQDFSYLSPSSYLNSLLQNPKEPSSLTEAETSRKLRKEKWNDKTSNLFWKTGKIEPVIIQLLSFWPITHPSSKYLAPRNKCQEKQKWDKNSCC